MGHTNLFSYNANGNLLTQTDPLGDVGTFNALIEAQSESALYVGALAGVASAVSDIVNRYFSGKKMTEEFFIVTLATAVVEAIVTGIFVGNTDLVFIVGRGRSQIIKQAIQMDKNQVIATMIKTEKKLLTWSYGVIMHVFGGLNQNGVGPSKNE